MVYYIHKIILKLKYKGDYIMSRMVVVNNVKGVTYMVTPSENVDQMIALVEETTNAYPELNTTIEVFGVGEMPLEKLPEEIKNKVNIILQDFNKCSVIHEHGKFTVEVGCCLKANYYHDYFVCGTYTA